MNDKHELKIGNLHSFVYGRVLFSLWHAIPNHPIIAYLNHPLKG